MKEREHLNGKWNFEDKVSSNKLYINPCVC
jgi:hypothetical protein